MAGGVLETARRVDPAVRVLYVDLDPDVAGLAGELLAGAPGVAMVPADLRDPARVFADPRALG